MILLTLSILFCRIGYCTLQLTTPSNENVDSRVSLSQCVLEASKRFFTRSFDTATFTLPRSRSSDRLAVTFTQLTLETLALSSNQALLIKDLNMDTVVFDTSTKSYSYIILIKDREEIDSSMTQLRTFPSWNPHARFLVVSPTVFPNPKSVGAEVIESLWRHNVLNGVVLLADPVNNTNFTVYTSYPYSKKSCGDKRQNTLAINSCSFGSIQTNRSWFEEKLPRQMNNCTLKVNYVNWPPYVINASGISIRTNYLRNQGMEVNIINMVATNLNLYVKYKESFTWGKVYANGSTTNDFQLLQNNSVDLLIGGYSSTYLRALYFDLSRPYIQESLIWCVPHVPISVGFNNMINIITTKVWISLIFAYLLISIFMWYLGSHAKTERLPYRNLPTILLINFTVLIGFSSNYLPKTIKVRYYMALLILLGMYITILYNTYLTSIIATPQYTEKYSTMKDIYEHNLKTYFTPNTRKYFESADGDRMINGVPISLINERWVDCNIALNCLKDVAEFKDSAYCTNKMVTTYLLNHRGLNNPFPSCMSTNVVSYPVALMMRKGFPLYDVFDKKLNTIVEAGFVLKWLQDVMAKHQRRYVVENDFDKMSIKFVNLRPIFYMLLSSYVVSAVVFVLEILFYRVKANNN